MVSFTATHPCQADFDGYNEDASHAGKRKQNALGNRRMLLAHTLHYSIPVPAAFDSLVTSLVEISRRWNGPHVVAGSKNAENLASKFAARLVQARDQDSQPLDFTQSAYSEEQSQEKDASESLQQRNLRPTILGPGHAHCNRNGIGSGSPVAHVTPVTSNQAIEVDTGIVDQNASPDSISLAFPPLPSAMRSLFSERRAIFYAAH